jgi:hypothetical protein
LEEQEDQTCDRAVWNPDMFHRAIVRGWVKARFYDQSHSFACDFPSRIRC